MTNALSQLSQLSPSSRSILSNQNHENMFALFKVLYISKNVGEGDTCGTVIIGELAVIYDSIQQTKIAHNLSLEYKICFDLRNGQHSASYKPNLGSKLKCYLSTHKAFIQ